MRVVLTGETIRHDSVAAGVGDSEALDSDLRAFGVVRLSGAVAVDGGLQVAEEAGRVLHLVDPPRSPSDRSPRDCRRVKVSASIELPPPMTRPCAQRISRSFACLRGAVVNPRVYGPSVDLAPFIFGCVPAFAHDASASDIAVAFVLIAVGTRAHSWLPRGIRLDWFKRGRAPAHRPVRHGRRSPP